MGVKCRFEHDEALNRWFTDFMNRAMPGVRFPKEAKYSIAQQWACDAYVYELDIKMTMPDGRILVTVEMVIHDEGFNPDVPDLHKSMAKPKPRFRLLRAGRLIFGDDGRHLRTLGWDDRTGRWVQTEGPQDYLMSDFC